MKKRVERTRNAGTLTESAFWGMIRAVLRKRTKFWKPKQNAVTAARRVSQSTNRKLKWEFQCSKCKKWFKRLDIEVHHSEEVGSLRCANDLPLFVERLFAEEGWVCLCKKCHKEEHSGKLNNAIKKRMVKRTPSGRTTGKKSTSTRGIRKGNGKNKSISRKSK